MTQSTTPGYIHAIARVCHEANRAYCANNRDFSQLGWEEAEAWQRESAIEGVKFVIANPNAGDSALHDAWLSHKEADGWVFGEVKDPEAKTHPCMVPFEQLPKGQQLKDRLFRAVVLSLVDLGDQSQW